MDTSFSGLLAAIWRRRGVAFLAFLCTLGLFGGYCLFAPRYYEGIALVLVDRGRVADAALHSRSDQDEARRALLVNTLVKLAQSEDIVRDAIRSIGEQKLYPDLASGHASGLLAAIREQLDDVSWIASLDQNLLSPATPRPATFEDIVFDAAKANMTVEGDLNTDLFRIRYRNRDPAVAATFANAVAASFLKRYSELTSNPMAVLFLKGQEERYDQAYDAAAKDLRAFADKTNIYSIGEQRTLLLKRRDKAVSVLAETRGDIHKVEGELTSLRTQLASLRSRMSLPPEIFGATAATPPPRTPPPSNDPALLHLKLYQDSSQLLVKGNSDLAGLENLEQDQKETLRNIDAELQQLSLREAEFLRLQRRMNEAAAQVETFARRKADAQFSNSWRANQSLSTVQLAQSAHPSSSPAEPKIPLVMFAGLLVSLCVGASAACFADRPRAHARSLALRQALDEEPAAPRAFRRST